jgi:predicted ATPase/DNA-binding SARP family transcriptional activator
MTGEVDVGLLGPVAVRVNGADVPLASVPQRVLLARLVQSPCGLAPVHELIDTLWPDGAPANAAANLQVYVSRLRKVIGRDRLTREPGGYRLTVDHVDIAEAERLVTEARALATTDADRAARLYDEALGLWRGEPLSDLPDQLPFAPELARLAEWRRQLRDEWFELRLAAGQAWSALPELERAVAADPLRESLSLALARALHEVGRTPEALQTIDGLRRRMAEDSGLDPSPAVAKLQRRLLADDPALRPPAPPVPDRPAVPPTWRAAADRLIGRAAELAALRSALQTHRVVTLVGPGGVGKTRLARELLQTLGDARAFVVEFGDVCPDQDVPAAAGAALGLRVAVGGVEAAIADLLGADESLLVLDNCEHVLDAARDLVAQLVARCPALHVLATSRRRLDHPGEQVMRLGPLTDEESVELFLDRASHLRIDFDPTRHARDTVEQICRSLAGLPLAVELAARREAVFGLAQLRDLLSAGLDVLDPAHGGRRTTAVAATVEWSYRLLDPDAQRLFDRLTVCRGGFTADALDHLCPVGLPNPPALLAELVEASLVDVSLVDSEPAADRPRYRLLEVMRRVGTAHLGADDLRAARAGHARWMESVAWTIHAHQNDRSPEAPRLLRAEIANMRAALGWLVDTEQWEQAGRLGILMALAVSDDPELSLRSQLQRMEPPRAAPDGALCTAAAGAAAWLNGDADRAERLLTVALGELARDHPLRWIVRLFRMWTRMYSADTAGVEADAAALKDPPTAPAWAVATGVCCAAMMHHFAGNRAGAMRLMDADRQLLDAIGELDGFVHYAYGELDSERDPPHALASFERAYRLGEARGYRYNRDLAGIGRMAVLIRAGRGAEAVPALRDLIEELRSVGMWPQLWAVLRLCAELLVDRDDAESAAVLLAAAAGDPLAPALLDPEVERHAKLWAAIGERLGPERVDAARREGTLAGRAGAARRALLALERALTAPGK